MRDFIVTIICNPIPPRLPSFMTNTRSHKSKISIHQRQNTGPIRINRRQITYRNHCRYVYKQYLPPSSMKPEKYAKHKGKN